MLNVNVRKLLDEQFNKELYSAYLYLKISDYYNDKMLLGFANWFKVQAQEERDHAMLFMQYLQNNGATLSFDAIAEVDKSFDSIAAPLEVSLLHEQFVTASINGIYEAAAAAKDYRTMQFLDWFIKEQGEEEANAETLIKKNQLFGSDGKGLYMLDSELAARVYSPPSLVL
ncbi:MAG: ferritin [Oscillospiraceae bacterium]